VSHPIFARVYARRSVAQAHLQEEHRRELLAGLTGRVLEVGCGNGLNFALYPPEVTEVVGVEPEAYLRHQAQLAAQSGGRSVTVLEGRAESVADVVAGPFDAVVFSLVLCSVADPAAVLRQAKRTLRDGASIRFYEHVVSEDPGAARLQRLFAPVWSAVAGGCRPDRDTLAVMEEEFPGAQAQRFEFCPGSRLPCGIVAPHLLGRAVYRG
jgi:SAM-dependent methyltransferase